MAGAQLIGSDSTRLRELNDAAEEIRKNNSAW